MEKEKRNKQKTAWNKENTVFIGIRLQKSTDNDIITYLQGKTKQAIIKKALRLLIKTESEAENN